MQTINLNIIPKGIPDVVNASQYDVGRVIQFALYDGATPYSIPLTATVQIAGKKGDNTIFCYDQADGVVSVSGNVVTITSTQQMTAFAGEVLAQLRVINSGATIATVNFKMLIQVRPDAEGDISGTEIPAIIALAEAEMYNAEAWAKGTKGGSPVSPSDPQYNDHAKYWAGKAQEYAVGAIHYKGSTVFASIPTSGMVNGDLWNVTDDFTTDSRFAEGSGKYCSAGTNIIWDEATSLWDIAGGLGGVTSWNNRRGDITPQANDYTAAQIKYGVSSNVDTELGNKANSSGITAAFNSTTAYAVGDYVIYEGSLYKCTTTHPAGDWNAAHFTETSVNSDFMAKGRDYVTAGLKSGTTLGAKATAEGDGVEASAAYAHAEGKNTKASSTYAHAEGYSTQATAGSAHAEGESSKATGHHSHAEGGSTTASHQDSHAEGTGTKTGTGSQHVGGKYNVGKSTTLFEIGNGTSNNARANAFEIDTSGNVKAAGSIADGSGNVLSAKLNASDPASKVAHKLSIGGSGDVYEFDGSQKVEIEIWDWPILVEATNWSATVDSDGYYTNTFTMMIGSYVLNIDANKPVFISPSGSTRNNRPTAAQATAYSLVEEVSFPDALGAVNTITVKAKTKPTVDFYIRLSAMGLWYAT